MVQIISSADTTFKRQSKYIFGLTIIVIISMLTFSVYNNNIQKSNQCKRRSQKLYSARSFHLPLNRQSKTPSPELCVVIRTFGPQLSYLPLLVLSLLHNDINKLRLFVVNTDARTDMQLLASTIDFISELIRENDTVRLLDLGPLPAANEFGFGVNDQVLEYLYDQYEKNATTCEYLLMTNGDNIYSRHLATKTLPHMKNKQDMILWSFGSRYVKTVFRPNIDETKNFNPQIVDDATEKCATAHFMVGGIDLSAAMYRLAFLNKYKIFFRRSDGPYITESDGYFIMTGGALTDKKIIIRQTLSFHQ